jgi:hypothetical protein
VQGLESYKASITSKGVAIAYEAAAVRVSGLGVINLFAVRDPDGNISEFYEPIVKAK